MVRDRARRRAAAGGPRRASGRRLLARLGGVVAVAFLMLVAATPAHAHVSITPSTTAAGAHAVLVVSVPHGCGGSSTTQIIIQMPEQVSSVTPTRNALWDVEKQVETLDPPVTDSHGNQVTERVASVTYRTDTPLPDGYRDVLELSLMLPDLEGDTLVFPTIQTCEQGEAAWIEVPADGQDPETLELPAPAFVLTAAGDGGHHSPAAEIDSSETVSGTGASGATAETSAVDPWIVAALVASLIGAVLGGTALVLQLRRT